MERSILISVLRFAITVGIACLLVFLLLILWPDGDSTEQGSGYGVVHELKLVLEHGTRSLFLITLALLFSIGFTVFSLLFSTWFRRPRFICLGVRTCLYIVSAIPTIFIGYLVLQFFRSFGITLYALGDDASKLQYYFIPALVLSVGDGLLNEFIHHAEVEIDAIRRENYVRMAKAIGAKMWPYIKNDFAVHFSRVFFSRITALISGTVVVEFVFNIQGLGWLAFRAAEKKYVSMLMLVLLCMVVVVSLLNLFYRLIEVILDPRSR